MLSCRQNTSAKGTVMQDYCLYLFRNPVIFTIDDIEKSCGGSTAILYSAKTPQYFKDSSNRGLKYDMISFRPTAGGKQYIANRNIPVDMPVELNDDFIIASAIKSMKLHSDMSDKRKSEFLECCMRIILISLESASKCIQEETVNIPKYSRLKEIRNNIYDAPMNEWSVDRVCRRLAISRTYFHRIYSNAFGVTFTQDVIESRMIYATELLENTNLSVSEIAEKCGYESDSYFMRQFRRHRGCTPTEYRKRKKSDSVG